jgi:hypothetical protein
MDINGEILALGFALWIFYRLTRWFLGSAAMLLTYFLLRAPYLPQHPRKICPNGGIGAFGAAVGWYLRRY